ncbi:MAG TPA: IMP dehydrogenase [Candidatus Nanoarchaeia archaeon]|nr:IMP dehydrogenase [Candidatus Nanoarchaeia archaeon]
MRLKEIYHSKEEVIKEGLTYDDVLLIPQLSTVKTRKEVDLSSRITKKLGFKLPIISANMDSVTEANMAIAMARCGGLGIVHRYLPIENQVKEILKVKRSEGLIVENPYCLGEDVILRDAKVLMKENNVSSVLIIDENRKLKGIITQRDVWFEENLDKTLKEIMTKDLITAEPGIKLEEAKEFFKHHKIEKLPIVDKKGILQGLITSKDLNKRMQYPNATKDSKGRLIVGGAIGVVGDYLERTEALLEAGTDVIVVDIAHGHSILEIDVVKKLRKEFGDIQIVGGNVATYEGAVALVNAGVDCVKVGIGPGATCITRKVTGSGVPQLTAVFECSKITEENDIPIIADGGIKNSGDIVKALAAGASSVMVGNLFGGTDESPGQVITKDGRKFKVYRGMASFGANHGRRQLETKKEDVAINDVVPEGVEAYVPYRGSVYDILYQLSGGIKSGLSYNGSNSIEELKIKAKFTKISPAGFQESGVHDVKV